MGFLTLLLFLLWVLALYPILISSYDIGPTCQDTFPDGPSTKWGLPSYFWSPKVAVLVGDWLNPTDKLLIESPQIPPYIQLPTPLLPTENKTMLTIYHQAITAWVHDFHTNDYDRKAIWRQYVEDAQCWLHQYACRKTDKLCYSDSENINISWDDSSYSINHGKLTIDLLQRSYYFALVDLGKTLIPVINQLEVFTDDDELTKRGIPKFAIHIKGLIDFYSDPVHDADHKTVSEPQLPLKIPLPQPLLSKTDTALLGMYRDAINAYDEDQTHSENDRWQNRQDFKERAWHWIVSDPCYYANNLCNVGDGFSKTLVGNFMPRHASEGTALRAEMVRQGLVDLGAKLLDEAKKGGGSPSDLKLALGIVLDEG